MSQKADIFSIRLVIADFYLEKPLRGLDPCYSEFRGKEIKKVPIIRIFGSNSNGQKTCMHVHGVFPYLYIPYESKDFDNVNKAIYNIAFSLDKAINISLGQGSSATQHVFKIQLVKGIPFYGYHRSEHQFLKIYMYNPRFVRRAANVLQNGAILGKVFHPLESHVPYVLQFMIDYNLYGMSFVHVPLDIVKFRRNEEDDSINFAGPINAAQVLSTTLIKKQTCSSLEIDISSNFILNRFQLVTKRSNSKHSNPGIEAIWNDEDLRRQKLIASYEDDEEKIKTVPPLEIPATQERPNVQPTESEAFYRVGLTTKLMALDVSLEQTLNNTMSINEPPSVSLNTADMSKRETQRTFNLKKLLANSVYPEECSSNEQLVDASCIENHFSGNSVLLISSQNSENSVNETVNRPIVDESEFLDDTLIDEELLLNLTQETHVPMNASLRMEDMELLDVLQQLEEQNENPIDLDSSLAPLSQPHKDFELTPEMLDKETIANSQLSAVNESVSDNECDDLLDDFSMALDDIDELLLKLSQSQTKTTEIPQVDGADDTICHTPQKSKKNGSYFRQHITPPQSPKTPKRNAVRSPMRSPRTPKSSVASKFRPLPLIITNRSVDKYRNESRQQCAKTIAPTRLSFNNPNLRANSPIPLHKELVITRMQRKTISGVSDLEDIEDKPTRKNKGEKTLTPRQSKKSAEDLEKTHVTCSLTPQRKSERLLKVCNVESIPTVLNKKMITRSKKNSNDSDNIPPKKVSNKPKTKKKFVEQEYKIKKVLVRIQKCDLAKMAKEFQNTQKRKNAPRDITKINEFKSSESFVNICSEEKNFQQQDNDIQKDLSELMQVLQKNVNKRTNIQKISTENSKLNTINNKNVSPMNSEKADSLPSSKNMGRQNIKPASENSELSSNSINNQHQIIQKKSENSKLFSDTESIGEKIIKRNSGKLKLSLSLKNNKKCKSLNSTKSLKSSSNSINIINSESSELFLKSGHKHAQVSRSNSESSECVLYLKSDESNSSKADESVLMNSESTCQDGAKQSALIKKASEDKRSSSQNNIKRNLFELVKSFENIESSNSLGNNLEIESNSIISPSSKKNFMFDKSIAQATPHPEVDYDEEIAGSDTETEKNTQFLKRTPSYTRLRRSFLSRKKSRGTPGNTPKISNQPETPSTSAEALQRLCELNNTMSPTVFSDYSSPNCTPKVSPTVDGTGIILAPLIFPPTRDETLKACSKLKIYEYEYQQPFYSNPDDITKRKEVGFTVLQIPGNKLNDCADFQSVLGPNVGGLTKWRREILSRMVDTSALKRYGNVERMREFFATKQRIIIQPHLGPPSRYDAKIWLKARAMLQQKHEIQIDQDSPIKVRRQKITMMFNDDAAGGGGDGEGDDMDATSCSLTLTPLTPVTPYKADTDNESENMDGEVTPLTTSSKQAEETSIDRVKHRRRSLHSRSVKTSLNEKLKAAAEKEMAESQQFKETDSMASTLTFSQHSEQSSNDSSSISSQLVLAELERSSFVKRLQSEKNEKFDMSFGLSSASLDNTFGFKVNLENLQEAKADIECNYLTSIVMELFVPTREELYPNPEFDEIRCIFYAIDNNIPNTTSTDGEQTQTTQSPKKACGYILVNDFQDIVQHEGKIHGIDADIAVKIVKTESAALEALLELCAHWDPDIYAGYEIEMSSWGYLIERAKNIGLNIAPLLSRVPTQKVRDFIDEDRDQFTDLDVEMKLCGRILLDVWRLMRSEIALTSYTFENVMYHILHKRCPWHSYRSLTTWFASPCSRWIVLEYYLERVQGILALLDQLDLIGRTSEMAKLIGIQFYEVLSRGSQFRVESMMLRIAKPRNLVPLSPSVQQRAHMRAPEYLPLILEPQSRFYADPLIVLDFQSLYPSMIIGYNYCFSTCLGRVEHLGHSEPFEFGASQLRVSPTMLRKLIDDDLVNISPCGVVFVKSKVREGILPRMLTEILDTRQMVKQSMKLHKNNSALQRILHSRQLGLKLMANVTYGYTAANFSGRMPAVEVGDSVVAKGRETLERTIKMVEANEKWGVKVVYGDTDSLFVLVPGRNREEAFKIGEEIAAVATKDNPQPVKLKLEKVYQPCILQTKKRYVGYMYETPEQTEPIYEAKGIETVRRDGCPAVAKMLEKVLRILFESADVSQVKQYVCRQFTKLLSGRANLQDLIFAKEFRGLNGYKPTACVPALELTRKWMQTDPRHIPRRGERVPFIITNGPPGVPLIRLVRSPHDVLADSGLKINAIYYITKAIIPPLNRCLLLIGADVHDWFTNLPRKILLTPALSTGQQLIATNQQKKSTISQYFSTTNCIIDCGRQTKNGICNICETDATKCVVVLHSKIAKIERGYQLTQQICQSCCGRVGDLKCGSLDCPVLYVLEVKRRDLQQIEHFRNLLTKF